MNAQERIKEIIKENRLIELVDIIELKNISQSIITTTGSGKFLHTNLDKQRQVDVLNKVIKLIS